MVVTTNSIFLVCKSRQHIIGHALLFLLIILAYAPVWDAGFVWDDPEQVVNNQAVLNPQGIPTIWTTVGQTPQYYPLTFTAFWLQCRLWGMEARWYHVVNVLLMWAVSVLLWKLFRRLGSPVAWFGACLFALHPVNVMSVAWVTELKNVLSGTLILLSILAYLPALENQGKASRQRIFAVFVLYVLAMFAKTASSFIPVALLLLHAWKGVRVPWRSMLLIGLMAAFAGIMSVITIRWEAMTKIAVVSDFDLNWPQRWIIFGQSFWFYLYKVLFPVNLAFFYERWEVPVHPPFYLWLFPCSVLALLLGLWIKRKSWGQGAWTVMTHYVLTTSAMILIHVLFMTRYTWVADHWQFFGLLGLIPALVDFSYRLLMRVKQGGLFFHLAMGVITVLFVFGVQAECKKYRDPWVFYKQVLVDNPKSWLAYNNLGRLYDEERGDKLTAIAHYQKSLEINPHNVEAVNNYGCALADIGQLAEAEKYFIRVMRERPDLPGVHNNLGRVLALQNKLDEARVVYEQALTFRPDDIITMEALGVVMARLSRFGDAVTLFSRILQKQPGDQIAHAYLGQVYTSMGQDLKAKQHFEQSQAYINSQPDHLNSYAWVVGTSSDPAVRDLERALTAAKKAVELAPENPWYRGTLAAIQSGMRQHTDAVATVETAITLARQQGNQVFIRKALEQKSKYEHLMKNQ